MTSPTHARDAAQAPRGPDPADGAGAPPSAPGAAGAPGAPTATGDGAGAARAAGGRAAAPARGVSGLVLMLLAAPAALGMTGPAIVLSDMANGYGVSDGVASWLVTTAGWGIAIGTPLAAGLINRRGLRTTLLTSALLLLVGSVLVAAVPWLPAVLPGRAAQAIGGSGLIAVAMNLAAGSARKMGLITSGIAAFAAVGPLVGSEITDGLTWQVVLVLPALSLLFVPFVARRAPANPMAESRFDVLGAVLLTALATALVFIPYFPLPAAICSVVAAALLALHIRRRPEGFVPMALLRTPAFLFASGLALALATSYFALLYIIPRLLTDEAGWSDGSIGIGTLVVQVIGSALSFVLAAVAARMGRPAVVAVLIALGVLAPLAVAIWVWAPLLLAAMAVALFAAAGGQATLMVHATDSVEDRKRPVAIGMFNLCYQIGGAFGPALATLFVI
ncbi:MFS transporter [Streptomyces sp. URMC 123]|uniref:MFS transporter n=1 Tax=Streptomyces sp. URMC 123 TaxID=3423403 RepID=UPI003F1BE14C